MKVDDKIQRQPETEEEAEMIQPKQEGAAVQTNSSSSLSLSAVNGIRSSGQPLGAQVRSFFEPRFGVDFSRVRVHADATAAGSAKAVGASAYTKDHHIAFAGGRYAPDTRNGKQLLAHELTHVIQQGAGKRKS